MSEVVKRKKKSGNNIGFLVFLIIVMIILLGVLIFIIKSFNSESSQKKKLSLQNQEVSFEAGADVPLDASVLKKEDILKGDQELIEQAVINANNVNFKMPGTYTATITSGEIELELTVVITDKTAPVITLSSDSISVPKGTSVTADRFISEVKDASSYEAGMSEDGSKDKMINSLCYESAGEYQVSVVALDAQGNLASMPVTINVTDIDYSKFLNHGATEVVTADTDFSTYSNDAIPYGFGADVDENNRPTGCTYYMTKYGKFAADFIQPESNYVYLTFDEGYEYGFTSQILDVLKEKNVKAVFFVTTPYVEENPDLVQRMIDEGHVVGNHTKTHPSGGLPVYDTDQQIEDIDSLTKLVKEKFGYDMYLFRFPEGTFSERSLAIVQSLGYRAVFWSFAHHDWNTNDQPDVNESLQSMLNKAHGGEIFLLHAVSQTNTTLLPDLIDGIRAKGYEFGYYAKVD